MFVALVIRSIPYLVALLLTAFEIPSRLLAYRHRHLVEKEMLDFATRWNKVSELVGYPFVVLFYALSEVGELFSQQSGTAIAVWAMVGGIVYSSLVLMALWLFGGAELQQIASLPTVRLFRWIIGFDGLVLSTKIVGVLFPGVLDLWLKYQALAHAVPTGHLPGH